MAQSKFEMDSGFITTGDSLITGNLTIIGTPVIGTHAATKIYVDTTSCTFYKFKWHNWL